MTDTTARDRLARILWECEYLPRAVLADCKGIADTILAAGWRPPARTVTTEEEAEALPEGTVVLDSERTALAEHVGCLWWHADPYGPGSLALPATVIYEPKEGE